MEPFFKDISFPLWREAWSQVYKTEPEYSPELFEGLHQMSLKSRSWGRLQYVGSEFYERTLIMPLAMIVDGKEIGWTCPFNTSDTTLRLRGTYILPEYRGRGLGRKLVEHALSLWPEPWNHCWVEVFENRKGFYESCGFSVVREIEARATFYEGVSREDLKKLPRSVMMIRELKRSS